MDIPITLLAAFNRETSGFIPLMLLGAGIASKPSGEALRKIGVIAALSLACFVSIYFGLRHMYAPRPVLNPPGIEMMVNNITDPLTWTQLFATLGIVPFLAMYSMKLWPRTLKIFFWIIVPLWFMSHLFSSIMAETRLFLVPFALVLIPGALFGIKQRVHTGPSGF